MLLFSPGYGVGPSVSPVQPVIHPVHGQAIGSHNDVRDKLHQPRPVHVDTEPEEDEDYMKAVLDYTC